MSADLFDELPFNLAGESLNSEFDAEQEAKEKRVRALAESEARKAQLELMPTDEIKTALAIHKRQDEIDAKPKRDFNALFNCPDCGWHFTKCDCKPCPTFQPAAQPYPNHRRCMNCETLVHKSHVTTHDCSKRFDRPYR